MKHFVKFNNIQDASGYQLIDIPYLVSASSGYDTYQNLHCNKPRKYIKVENNEANIVSGPLAFKSHGTTTISLHNENSNQPDIKYSLDNCETWVQWNYNSILLNDGDIIYFKGNNPNGISTINETPQYSSFVFGGTGTIEAYGNIMSLIDDGACNTLTIPNAYCFTQLFSNCTSLITAPELSATTLSEYCYSSMFYGCTSLITAPELPATTLTYACYSGMFYGCTSLTNAPELPATTLTYGCYTGLFSGCTSLTNAPELPATTLAIMCYASMFYNCTSLTNAPELPATTLAIMCYEQMFAGCTSLTNAPDLLALTLVYECYFGMFYGCTNLSYVKCLAISGINQQSSTLDWLTNAKAYGTFVRASSATWPSGTYAIPEKWVIKNY